MVGTPASELVDLVSARIHKAKGLAPPPPGAPSPLWRTNGLPPLQALVQREPVIPPPP